MRQFWRNDHIPICPRVSEMMRKALHQGDMDGFCGLYSICNCLRLLHSHLMNDDTSTEVWKVAAKTLTHWPAICWDGTEHEDMCMMLDSVRAYLLRRAIYFDWSLPFAHHRVHSWIDFQAHLEGKIASDDAFAIVGLSEPWEHWTVAHRFTPSHILMTDSCEVKEIPLDQCGLTGGNQKYLFDYKDTFILNRVTG